ncbi:MAG: GNAT family N-acetyltransferase [Bacteroidia bacterium]
MLSNPAFNALSSGDSHLGSGTENVKFFEKEVSPFAGFRDEYKNGFDDLYQLLPVGRNVIYATREKITEPHGWKLITVIEGTQFILDSKKEIGNRFIEPVPLQSRHVDEMVKLAALTKPGPFDNRTIEFGNYFGIFENDRLVAMTGQRMHVYNFTEVSAVCTHPHYTGKGYAAILLDHQLDLIVNNGQHPFLHVRWDNNRAISLYERIGFKANGPMNFYFLKRL